MQQPLEGNKRTWLMSFGLRNYGETKSESWHPFLAPVASPNFIQSGKLPAFNLPRLLFEKPLYGSESLSLPSRLVRQRDALAKACGSSVHKGYRSRV
jgi:hypothetical protein